MSGSALPRRALKRVERTFAFLDLCGFTAYTDEKGDAAACINNSFATFSCSFSNCNCRVIR